MGVLPVTVPQGLAYAIDSAGTKSDVDFDYLLQTAIRESSLNPTAKASTSSATGLFQFLDSTWLEVLKAAPRLPGLCRRDPGRCQRRLHGSGQGLAQGNSETA